MGGCTSVEHSPVVTSSSLNVGTNIKGQSTIITDNNEIHIISSLMDKIPQEENKEESILSYLLLSSPSTSISNFIIHSNNTKHVYNIVKNNIKPTKTKNDILENHINRILDENGEEYSQDDNEKYKNQDSFSKDTVNQSKNIVIIPPLKYSTLKLIDEYVSLNSPHSLKNNKSSSSLSSSRYNTLNTPTCSDLSSSSSSSLINTDRKNEKSNLKMNKNNSVMINTKPKISARYRMGYDYIFKIIVVGDVGVGKSTLIHKFSKNEIYQDTGTCEIQCNTVKCEVENIIISLQLWDTGGQERFRTLTSSYYRGAHGIIIVFDVNRRDTLLQLDNWIYESNRYCLDNVCKILIGNKCDLINNRNIDYDEGKMLADQFKIPYHETSALNGSNVHLSIMNLVHDIKLKNEFN